MAKENIRAISYEALYEILERGEYSHLVIRAVLDKYAYLEKRDRAFFTRLTEGTIERCVELDYLIEQVSATKVKKMKPQIRTIIRMGAYQLKYMDAVPDSAACNEAVKLAKKKGFASLSGFVNGVLRNLARKMENLKYPSDEMEELSVRASMPLWLVEHFVKSYGMEKTKDILHCFLAEQPTSIRVNIRKIDRKTLLERLADRGILCEPSSMLEEAAYLSSYDRLSDLDEFAKGLFSVQDISSMMVGEWINAKPGERILDVCAAPGGKALHAYERMGGSGQVIARDLTSDKVDMILENAKRLGADHLTCEIWDATVFDSKLSGKMDAVIADLPCSGLGIIGKKTDIKYKITKEQLDELSELQKVILKNAAGYVKPGGRLVFSTCTMNPGENEENVRWFEEQFPEFSFVKKEQVFPKKGISDGFFISLFIKKERA
ncbi:16S rRNA (cytosine(967)-C(5))-methyltransferase RsmB [Eubacterium oxidoreducens]|uniref:16S rRNA (cytosine(967)-C(5))-methyltransferase n=1 Tax=Eubacterium oxidoreducens TaxID=1732 RepID=A0A1G6B627_EUBOX|nr:16S rRNA (cytosine(967)-C(5))-methyltransferase RsmB [Eubacterium oxidoreducens]SDB16097.1 16S rRNA (cytosine967-C5)-methyltransferase [Eubacterium oxidoreducens]